MSNRVVFGDNLEFVRTLGDGTFRMAYLDPPFNTGRRRSHATLTTTRADSGDRTGFGGRRYATAVGEERSYQDAFDDYLAFLQPRLSEVWRVLDEQGTLYLHLDSREVHHVKVMLDAMVGRRCFLNEVIWAYDYGARSRRRWPAKHDNILVYVKDPDRYWFDSEGVDREPYMAPGLVTAEKVARGKLPTDVWWHTIVPPTGREKTGYPTQKPEAILRRMILASTREGDAVLDCFAGSGTTGAVARALSRSYVLVDDNPEAIAVMRRRLGADADYVVA